MIHHSSYHIRGRKGNLLKFVKEHYLRDDISCGADICAICNQTANRLSGMPPVVDLVPSTHLMVLDSDVIIKNMDILEVDGIKDVVILQNVIEEIRNINQSVYHRLRTLIENPSKSFYVFCNLFHREAFSPKGTGETPDEYSSRLIRLAVKWYCSHLAKSGVVAVLLTEDAESCRKAREMGLCACSFRNYIFAVDQLEELVDLLPMGAGDMDVGCMDVDQEKHFEYYPSALVNLGIKRGVLVQGTLNIDPHKTSEGFIYGKVEGKVQVVAVIGHRNLNRAIHGDFVAVEISPREQWRKTQQSLAVPDEIDESEVSQADFTPRAELEEQPVGRVVSVVRRANRLYCGSIDLASVGSSARNPKVQFAFFLPVDRRIPRILICTRRIQMLVGKRIAVALDDWMLGHASPLGHLVKVLGEAEDVQTETEVLLVEHDVTHRGFSASVLSCLPAAGEAWRVEQSDLVGREDFRHLPVCSIDPPGCTDIDDALHVQTLPDGTYEVGVHIADVTHFVKPNTAIDKEAMSRGNTVYLVDRRIDMLPGLLGTKLCSLRSKM